MPRCISIAPARTIFSKPARWTNCLLKGTILPPPGTRLLPAFAYLHALQNTISMQPVDIRQLIIDKDYEGLNQALSNDPALANEGLPYDAANTTKAHPLHRICDGVFINKFTDEEGVEIAKIFLEHGANVNGNEMIPGKDSPLVAAASLHADQLAIFYIENGANIHHPGCHGGTALHWAAWCGRPGLVKRFVEEGADIHKLCIDFKSTPLFWAVHGLKEGDKKDLPQHLQCVKILVEAGSDKTIPNAGGTTVFDMAKEEDVELREILNG